MKRGVAMAAAVACALLLAFWAGKRSVKVLPAKQTTHVKEHVKWNMVAHVETKTAATAVSSTRTKVVTRWLRPDGTPLKEQTRETGVDSTVKSQVDVTARSSESRTEDREVKIVAGEAPRLSLGVMVGLDKKPGGYVNYRIVGPVTVGAWGFQKMGGVSVGLTF